jgi:hypothetical protein
MKSTAFVTNLLNAPLAKKEKRLCVFTHPYFSTACGKISGKSKNTLRRRIFSSVEKQNDFQHFSKKGMIMLLSGRIFFSPFAIHFPTIFTMFSVSTFLCTFFPFPQRIFSRISTSHSCARIFPQSIKVFRVASHLQSNGNRNAKNQTPQGFFGLFQLFYML